MSMVEFIMENQDLPHREICIAFTPDEEIGRSTENFDIKRFGADFAYTIDGEKLGEISYENFNAVAANIRINGKSVHPGFAKNKMINASYIACEFNNLLPKEETPRNTEGREGFYHLVSINSSVNKAEVKYNLRDFEKENMKKRIQKMEDIAKILNEKYGENTVILEFREQYENMKPYMKENMNIIEKVIEAGKRIGVESFINPIRGGFDGEDLSKKGLPCPNLGAGGRNFHGVYEYVCIEDMVKITEILIELVK